MLCCWPIRSFRAESHAARTGSLSLLVPLSPTLPPRATPPRDRAPSGPRRGASVRPLRSPLIFSPRPSRSSHGPSSSQRVFPAAPAAAGCDSPDRLTGLTVSTAGWRWLAGWLASPAKPATQPATFLLPRVCRGWGLPGVTCQPVASVHSRHFEQPVRSPLGRARTRL